ncbi:MAG: hypothetical protein A2341_25400 [Deltaproteobacteria bacterium RIFOXYB12_FULL_58_9]|nr:MAG: hypothetical protein A2341_25400 [Deltaproteobacteria bacterium RIFOXYB12_FULL_58_9]
MQDNASLDGDSSGQTCKAGKTRKAKTGKTSKAKSSSRSDKHQALAIRCVSPQNAPPTEPS